MKDPVCGMTVTERSSHVVHREGLAVYFCCAGCKAKFLANPASYPIAEHASAAAEQTAPARPAGAIFTCPMHPEVRQAGPGSCPLCGMALDPLEPSADAGANPELVDMRRRFWIGLPLACLVLVLGRRGTRRRRGLRGFSSRSRRRSCGGAAGRSWRVASTPCGAR